MIVVTYPCIGKRTLTEEKCFRYFNLTSDNYDKTNKRWIKKYIKDAIKLDTSEDYQFIFIECDEEIIDELNKQEIKYWCIYPSLKLKTVWLRKCFLKSVVEEVIDKKSMTDYNYLKENFDKTINNLMKQENRIEITKLTYNLEDLLKYIIK